VNTASVQASDAPDPAGGNDSDSDQIDVLLPAGLALGKVVDDPTPAAGDLVTFTINVVSGGPGDATGVQVTDLLPAGLTFAGASTAWGTYDDGTGLWDIGTIDADSTAILDLQATVDAGTEGTMIVNTAAITASDLPDPDPLNDSDDATVDVMLPADLDVAVTVDTPDPLPGATVTFAVHLGNAGPGDATGIEVTDPLPAGLTFADASPTTGIYDDGTGIWNVGSLASAAVDTLYLSATVDAGNGGAILTNTASVTSLDQPDPAPGNDSDAADVTVQLSADLALEKTVDAPLAAIGQTVTFVVALASAGPDDATGVEITDLLPAGLTFFDASPTTGSYDDGTGVWDVGNVAAGAADTLYLRATVDAGTSGLILNNVATITASDLVDPVPGNDDDDTDVTVLPSADLAVTQTASAPQAAAGDTIVFTVALGSVGPDIAPDVTVQNVLDTGLVTLGAVSTRGSYNFGTGDWTLGAVTPADADTLVLTTLIAPGHEGETLSSTATVVVTGADDPNAVNDVANGDVTIPMIADLAVAKMVDIETPGVGEVVDFSIILVNSGPSEADGVLVADLLPAGLVYDGSSVTQGNYSPISGDWTVGTIDSGELATLTLSARVTGPVEGLTLVNTATVTASSLPDPDGTNDSASAEVEVLATPVPRIHVTPVPGVEAVAYPDDALRPVLVLDVVNTGGASDTFEGLTVTNTTLGPGTEAEIDAEWRPLVLAWASIVGDDDHVPADSAPMDPVAFVAGRATFTDLDIALAPGDTVRIAVHGAPSLTAVDANRLAVEIDAPEDITLLTTTVSADEWPLVSGYDLIVDGLVAAQVAVMPVEGGLLGVGSQRNLVLDVVLPANGYLADTLQKLNIVNAGTAQPGTDIAGMEAWADDGDGEFIEAFDTWLGAFVYTGDRWELTGLGAAVPKAGQRVFVTVDVAETAEPIGNAIRLGLPMMPDPGIGMASANDGPVDVVVENPQTHGVSATDRVILTAEWIHSTVVYP